VKINRAIKIRLYPNQKQKEMLNKTFGCCRFIYNKMLEERIQVYQKFKSNKDFLYSYDYKTEKQYKQEFLFLKEVDSKALQSEWRHLTSAYANFFRNIKKGTKKGFPNYKSKKSKQSYTTYNINNNCKIDFEKKKLKLPKISNWIKYKDDRIFEEEIKHITVLRNRSGYYYASILIEIDLDVEPIQKINSNKIVGFDMSASKFLITKDLELSNPRFYRNEQTRLKKLHKEQSRRKKSSNNRDRTRKKLANVYEKITDRKKDWVHKITHLLSEHFDCIILEDLNIKKIQLFNSELVKSVSLDFSWYQFISTIAYKMKQKGKHLILIDRYFPSSRLCSECWFKNDDLKLNDRKWTCPKCNTHHDRDVNASVNIENEGLIILKENNIKIIRNNDIAVGTTVNAFGEDVRLILDQLFSMNYESITL